MGKLHYGAQQVFEFEDRTLAHLRSVMTAKLLRQESFLFSWDDHGKLRSIWLHPTSIVLFEFEGSEEVKLNRAWLEHLADLANTSGGLRLVPEPDEPK